MERFEFVSQSLVKSHRLLCGGSGRLYYTSSLLGHCSFLNASSFDLAIGFRFVTKDTDEKT